LNLQRENMNTPELSKLLEKEAISLGFARMGICKSETVDEKTARYYNEWVDLGYHSGMEYLSKNRQKRLDPGLLWEHETKSVIVLAINYYSSLSEELLKKSRYKIARYAHGKNYHNVIKKKLKIFCNKFEQITGGSIRAYIDTAPIMEKYWAAKAGIGIQGKNTCMISPEFGSWIFLACCITNVELESTGIFTKDLCGSCTLCLDACPTGALVSQGKLDTRKCIAYLTIEHKEEFNEKTPEWKDWIWGCDICQQVCPHNQNIDETKTKDFSIMPAIRNLMNGHFNPETFEEQFSVTSLKRGGKHRILRNIQWIEKR